MAARSLTGLAARVGVFSEQLAAWRAIGRGGAPVFGLPGVVVQWGACLSCGAALAKGSTYRCAVCLRAVELVLGLEPHDAQSPQSPQGHPGRVSLHRVEGDPA
jgi:hypothetical protein